MRFLEKGNRRCVSICLLQEHICSVYRYASLHCAVFTLLIWNAQVVGSRADENTWSGCSLPEAPNNYFWVVGEDGWVVIGF
jgi:hypothetical protein